VYSMSLYFKDYSRQKKRQQNTTKWQRNWSATWMNYY
jgi:hypothetical protein